MEGPVLITSLRLILLLFHRNMETSTFVFVGALAIAFIFLRWLITPIPQTIPYEIEEIRRNDRPRERDAPATRTTARGTNREITDSMIEVVQAIAPQLTPGQIRYDLERSGSVEATIDRYMEAGSLPFPPGELAPVQPAESAAHNIPPSTVSLNLLEKYGIDADDVEEAEVKEDDKSFNLHKKRKEMILNARKRLASLLKNDISI